MLVSIEDAREHLNIFAGQSDSWLEIMIPAVSQAVLLWLKEDWRAYEMEKDADGKVVVDAQGRPVPLRHTDGIPVVKPTVVAAVLVELANRFEDREGENTSHVPAHWGHGYSLGVGATALLVPLRKTTVA